MAKERRLDSPDSGLNAALATNTFLSGWAVTTGKKLLVFQVMVSTDAAVGTQITINEESAGGNGIRFYWENTNAQPIPIPGDGWLLAVDKSLQGKHESGSNQKFAITVWGKEVD